MHALSPIILKRVKLFGVRSTLFEDGCRLNCVYSSLFRGVEPFSLASYYHVRIEIARRKKDNRIGLAEL